MLVHLAAKIGQLKTLISEVSLLVREVEGSADNCALILRELETRTALNRELILKASETNDPKALLTAIDMAHENCELALRVSDLLGKIREYKPSLPLAAG
jgi:hypothetical protein